MRRKIATISLIILLSYINGPFFFVGITVIHRLFYYGISIIPLTLAIYLGIKNNSNLKFILMLFLIYIISIILVMLITMSLDFIFFVSFIRSLLYIFSTLSVFYVYRYFCYKYDLRIDFQTIVIKAAVFYIIGTIIFICCPPLKNIWSSIIVNFQRVDFTSFVEYLTRYGFAGYSGYLFAFWISATSISFSYKYLNNELKGKKQYIYIFLLLVGSFFYGRIGFVLTVINFGLLSVYSFINGRRKLLHFFIILIFIVIITGWILYFSIPDIQPFINWLLEPIFNYINGGKLESASTNGLKRFYENFHPSDRTLFWGDGYWIGSDGKYYGHTDVGFMRNIYYGGIFYTLIQYSVVFSLILCIFLWMKNNKKKGYFLISFLLFVNFVLFEMKGDIAFMFIKQFLPIYFSMIYEKNYSIKIYSKKLNNIE